jgi:D-ribulokinase
MTEVVIGIDVGTQGARVLAVDPDGNVQASAQAPFDPRAFTPGARTLPPGWFEQHPRAWWEAVSGCLRQVLSQLPGSTGVAGVSVDSTSGTLLPVDDGGEPLHPALMYNDQRSESQAGVVQAAAKAHQERFGFVFGTSYALPKMVWFRQARPEVFAKTRRFLHAADFINGRLTGEYGVSDTSNALKSGYDLIDLRWPDFIERDLGIPAELLPRVVLPGQKIGQVSARAAEETGLPVGTAVLAGATDGTAAQIASGAAQPGEWNSTLGTTLVVKGVCSEIKPDPLGRVYFHRHPEGWWMPGGASNTGAGWILKDHPGADPDALNQQAEGLVPTRLLRYPLTKRGERFPFLHPEAESFLLGESDSAAERYAAGLEGVALLERLAYETLDAIGLETGGRVFITGGGSKSKLWSQIRASALDKCLVKPAETETAFGAAVLAASGCWYATLSEAAGRMVRAAEIIEPVPAWREAYAEHYQRFFAALSARGYLGENR